MNIAPLRAVMSAWGNAAEWILLSGVKMDTTAKRTVLVVDDDAAMRKVLTLGLEKSGFHVKVARDGREALDLLVSIPEPDCVLLDIRMPVLNGREALPYIHDSWPTLPVIMLTAFNDLENGIESMRAGAFDYLVKPVRIEGLLQSLERAFNHRELLKTNLRLTKDNEEYRLTLERMVEARTNELDSAYLRLRKTNLETVRVLAETIEVKDPYTRGHCGRVRLFSVGIARVLGVSSQDIEILEYSSLLHDIGKIAIPETVLNKPDRLDEYEFSLVKQHPEIGAQILSHVEFFSPCLAPVRQHHERWDGRGYPDGRKESGIDSLARIIAVSDAFDAMTSSRPYRPSMPLAIALEEIRKCTGTQFAPEVAEAFLAGKVYELGIQ